jgi:hypothetical protein
MGLPKPSDDRAYKEMRMLSSARLICKRDAPFFCATKHRKDFMEFLRTVKTNLFSRLKLHHPSDISIGPCVVFSPY